MADYKVLPYRASQDLHKVGEQNWVILSSNEKSKNYEKPELIKLADAKSIMGFVDGDDHYLLFQATDSLVSNNGKPELARATFGKFVDQKWENDEVGAKAWSDAYEASNRWVALECNFPILKALAKWLDSQKIIISELVYVKVLDVDENKLFAALNTCKACFLEEEDFEECENDYKYLNQFGLETLEFLEKEPKLKSKALPLEGTKKGEDGLLTYEKVLFTAPPKSSSDGGSKGKGYQSQSQMASSRLEFLLGNAEKIKQLPDVYPSAELLSIALALAGSPVPTFDLLSLYGKDKKTHLNDIAAKETKISNQPTVIEAEIVENKLPTLKELIEVFGEVKINKWLSQLQGLADTGANVSLLLAQTALKAITESQPWNNEQKNVLLWCKEHLTKGTVKSVLDLKYEDLLTLSNACRTVNDKFKEDGSFSILDLKLEDVEITAF